MMELNGFKIESKKNYRSNDLASYRNYFAVRVMKLVRKVNINMIANPPTNMALQDRLDSGAQRVGDYITINGLKATGMSTIPENLDIITISNVV